MFGAIGKFSRRSHGRETLTRDGRHVRLAIYRRNRRYHCEQLDVE
jgi:hypothetical protein